MTTTSIFKEEKRKKQTGTDIWKCIFCLLLLNLHDALKFIRVYLNEEELDKLGDYIQNLPLLQVCFADLSPEVPPEWTRL